MISGSFTEFPEEHVYLLNGLKKYTSKSIILRKEIKNYYFGWTSISKNGQNEHCIALGYGSLYNSDNSANMRYEANEKNLNMLFIAVVDIPKDTELTVNYSGINGSHISEGNSWFTDRKIEFIK